MAISCNFIITVNIARCLRYRLNPNMELSAGKTQPLQGSGLSTVSGIHQVWGPGERQAPRPLLLPRINVGGTGFRGQQVPAGHSLQPSEGHEPLVHRAQAPPSHSGLHGCQTALRRGGSTSVSTKGSWMVGPAVCIRPGCPQVLGLFQAHPAPPPLPPGRNENLKILFPPSQGWELFPTPSVYVPKILWVPPSRAG